MPSVLSQVQKKFRWMINAGLLFAFALEIFAPNFSPKLDVALIILAAISSIAALARQLPLQNVLLAAAIIGVIGGLAHGLSSRLAIPFGPIIFAPTFGKQIFNVVPWTIPLLWIVIIFNARGMARLILRTRRKSKNYGFWLIGITLAFALAFDFVLEPYASCVKHWWRWEPNTFSPIRFGTPLTNFLSWLFVSAVILAFTTPALLKKKPDGLEPISIEPLIIWSGGIILLGIGAARNGLWPAVFFAAGILIVSVTPAVRGAQK